MIVLKVYAVVVIVELALLLCWGHGEAPKR